MIMTQLKKGRPSTYSAELAKEICDTISSSSKGTKALCKENSHWPSQDTLFTWLKTNNEFSEQYAQAKRCQIELLVDEILEIADDSSKDCMVNEQGVPVFSNTVVTRAKLQIDTRKWLACKLLPKVYGNKLESTHALSDANQKEMTLLLNNIAAFEAQFERDY